MLTLPPVNVYHNGLPPCCLVTPGRYVFDLDQSPAEAEEVKAYLDTYLALVDPARGACWGGERARRTQGAQN